MSMWIFRSLKLAATLLVLLVIAAIPVYAQQGAASGLSSDTTKTSADLPSLPEPLTRQAIRDVLSGLNDTQVRDLLVRELDQKVAAREAQLAKRQRRSIGEALANMVSALGRSWVTAVSLTPRIPEEIAETFARYQAKRGDIGSWRVLATLLVCVLVGVAAAFFVTRLIANQRARLDDLQPSSLWAQIGIGSARLLLEGVSMIAFVITAHAVNAFTNNAVSADSSVVLVAINTIAWTWLAVILARFVLSPARPNLRLFAVDDANARFLVRRAGMIFGLSAVSIGLLSWLEDYGWPFGEVRIGFWLGVIFYGLIMLTIWQARHGIAKAMIGEDASGPVWQQFARHWPLIAIGVVAAEWLIVELFVATTNIQSLSMTAMNVSLVVVIALPIIAMVIRSVVGAIWPDDPEQEPALRAAHRETQAGLVRCGRIIIGLVMMLGLARLWGLNLHDVASQGVGAELAGALLQIALIVVLAYGLWEVLNIAADRQLAIERITLALDEDEGEDSETIRGGTRLGTLMPLLRAVGRVAIVTLAVLAILGQLGVNIAPLLAGAGIFGLAIGFGAQTLVKDIISGAFFLIDDAFRKGEYIDIGSVKGTVEKISIRSMQLRHHNGPINTVPFGEIRHLTNYSRDWVIMKLSLRVTYDTDVERLRKLIKRLGLQLMEDPELGPKFLEPLKSQGVVEMDDSAMILRVKFMTRPGDQFTIRNKVFTLIREMFEQEGIKFAHREVTVHHAVHERGTLLSDAETEAAAAAARRVIEQDDAKAGKADVTGAR
jgi:small-conductance mechanosensitive channel